MQNILTFVMY